MVAKRTMDYAQLSLVAYGDEGKQSDPWKELEGRKYEPTGGKFEYYDDFQNKYEIDVPADFYGQVFYNPEKLEIVFALRGTETGNTFDYLSDTAMIVNTELLNKLMPRMTVPHFGKAVDFFNYITIGNQNYADKYNAGYKLIITGHSLGGACAQYLALKLYQSGYKPAVHTETFNAPGILESLKKEDAYGYNELDIINHVRYTDPVGTFGTHLGECRYYTVDNESPHSMRNFYLDLENDPPYYENQEGEKAYLEGMSRKAQDQFIQSGGNLFPNF